MAHSTTRDNKIFTIIDAEKEMKNFEEFAINFFVKFQNFPQAPATIVRLKFNDMQICPPHNEFATSGCASFEMMSNGSGGRWDAKLTVNQQGTGNELKIDLEFDEVSWALGVSFSIPCRA